MFRSFRPAQFSFVVLFLDVRHCCALEKKGRLSLATPISLIQLAFVYLTVINNLCSTFTFTLQPFHPFSPSINGFKLCCLLSKHYSPLCFSSSYFFFVFSALAPFVGGSAYLLLVHWWFCLPLLEWNWRIKDVVVLLPRDSSPGVEAFLSSYSVFLHFFPGILFSPRKLVYVLFCNLFPPGFSQANV